MCKIISRVAVAVAVAAALSILDVSWASVSGANAKAGHPVRAPAAGTGQPTAIPGAQLWLKRYNGAGHRNDLAYSLAVSPDGGTVFVTGESRGATSWIDYATVAYNTATGAPLWARRYNGPGNGRDVSMSVAVSPDGGSVFVTGLSYGGSTSGFDYATIAYNAATGAQLWVKRYNGLGNSSDSARSVTVSPTGTTVFVTGDTYTDASNFDYVTVAYNAATGARLWAKRYTGPGIDLDEAMSVAASPDGEKVFVTGGSHNNTSGDDYATVAYSAATGAQLWVKRYNGPGNSSDWPSSVTVSPTGGTVFVTGTSALPGADSDFLTVAYSAATGTQLWVKLYSDPGKQDWANSLAVSPDGGTVYVTGYSGRLVADRDYATVAYSAATGAQLWVNGYNGPVNRRDEAKSVAVSPNGGTVYVTGFSNGGATHFDYATAAYRAATGAQLWVNRYNGPGNGDDEPQSTAVTPTGDKVFVAGYSQGANSGYDYTTIAYSG